MISMLRVPLGVTVLELTGRPPVDESLYYGPEEARRPALPPMFGGAACDGLYRVLTSTQGQKSDHCPHFYELGTFVCEILHCKK